MEKLASAGTHALLDATNVRAQLMRRFMSMPSVASLLQQQNAGSQLQHLRLPTSTSSPSPGRVSHNNSDANGDYVEYDGDNEDAVCDAENAAPLAAASRPSVGAGFRKRPRDDEDEVDGPLSLSPQSAVAAVAARLPPPPPPPVKRCRAGGDSPLLAPPRAPPMPAPCMAPMEAVAEPMPATLPINLVKRECSIALCCVAEHRTGTGGGSGFGIPGSGEAARKGYVMVPSSLTVSELTRFALDALGISGVRTEDCSAKLALPGWRQLSLDEICADRPEATSAASLLSHVSNVAILRVEMPPSNTVLLFSGIMRTLLVPQQILAISAQVAGLRQVGCPPTELGDSADGGGCSAGSSANRCRTRVLIDPTTEIPQLERWFAMDSHPTSAQFKLYAQALNEMPFRQRQPRLESKNVQSWFKNQRAKVKRERSVVTLPGEAAADSAADTTADTADGGTAV